MATRAATRSVNRYDSLAMVERSDGAVENTRVVAAMTL